MAKYASVTEREREREARQVKQAKYQVMIDEVMRAGYSHWQLATHQQQSCDI